MVISIVLSTYNKADFLKASLANLNYQKADRKNFEVIVVVDGSTDNTLDLLSQCKCDYQLRYEYKENGGLVSARNCGIDLARGDVILFMDDDIIYEPLFLVNLHEKIRQFPDSVHAGNLFNIEMEYTKHVLDNIESIHSENFDGLKNHSVFHPFYEAIKVLFNRNSGNTGDESNPTVWWAVAPGGNLCIPKTILDEIGHFDPQIRGWGPEDADLAYRIFKKGYPAIYNENCILYHLDHKRDNKKIVQSMIKYAFMLYKKHDKSPEWLAYLNFFNGLISLEEFNNNCAKIAGLNPIHIKEFYMKNFMDYRGVGNPGFKKAYN